MPLKIQMGRIFEEPADVLVLDQFYYPTDNERKVKIRQLQKKCIYAPFATSYIKNTTDNPLFQDIHFEEDFALGLQSFANLFECEWYDICEEQKCHRCTALRTYDEQFGADYLLVVNSVRKLMQSVSAETRLTYAEYGHIIRCVIFSILQLLEKLSIHSVKMPVFCVDDLTFSLETKVILTIEAVKEYLRLHGDLLHVTIVLSNYGLPEDLYIRRYNETDGLIKALEQIYPDLSYDPAVSLKDTVKQLCSHGFDISESYQKELGLISEIQMMEKRFQQEKKAAIMHKQITEAEYGRQLQLAMQEQYEFSEYALTKITGMSKNTFSKFRKGETQKHDKTTLLCIALAMELPLEDFCRYIWAAGEAFPCDERDDMVCSNIGFGVYDIDTIDDDIIFELGESQRLTKLDQKTKIRKRKNAKNN